MISEDSNDYRRELAAARRAVEELPRDGSPATLDACWEVCCGDVLIAEENLAAQDRVWENAALARELLSMATYLEGYDSMLDGLRSALARMADALYDHPRLKLSLLEFELQVIYRLEALCDRLHGAFCARAVGTEDEVLFESTRRAGMMFGFTGAYRRVRVPYDAARVNTICRVKLLSMDESHDLIGEILD